MLTHKKWQELIPFYLARTLSDAETAAFEAYMRQNEARCQPEVTEWRIVASAVWREADAYARALPPLSSQVYQRLTYRTTQPASAARYPAPPPATPPPVLPGRRGVAQRTYMLPLSMVAGFTLAMLFGGIVILLVLNFSGWLQPGPLAAPRVALDASATPTVTNTTIPPPPEPTATQTPIPQMILTQARLTQAAQDTMPQRPMGGSLGGAPTSLSFVTNTPVPFLGMETMPQPSATQPIEPSQTPLPSAHAVMTEPRQQQLITPLPPTATIAPPVSLYVTPIDQAAPDNSNLSAPSQPLDATSQLSAQVADGHCTLVNETAQPVNVHSRTTRTSPVVGVLQVGEHKQVRVTSDGWYEVYQVTGGILGWVSGVDITLIGDCSMLWTPTPTQNANQSTGLSSNGSYRADGVSVVEVATSFADVRSAPGITQPVITVLQRGESSTVLAWFEDSSGTNQSWALLRLNNGQEGWVWADSLRVIDPPNVPTRTQ